MGIILSSSEIWGLEREAGPFIQSPEAVKHHKALDRKVESVWDYAVGLKYPGNLWGLRARRRQTLFEYAYDETFGGDAVLAGQSFRGTREMGEQLVCAAIDRFGRFGQPRFSEEILAKGRYSRVREVHESGFGVLFIATSLEERGNPWSSGPFKLTWEVAAKR